MRLKDDLIGGGLRAVVPTEVAYEVFPQTTLSSTGSRGDLKWQYFDETSYVAGDQLKENEDAYARNQFNQKASDKLKSNRDVPDTRGLECKAAKWPSQDLPSTSVIITFHNEARSALLRTIVR